MKTDNSAFDRHAIDPSNLADLPAKFKPFVLPGFKSVFCKKDMDDFFYQFRIEPGFLIGEHRFNISQDLSIPSSTTVATRQLSFILEGSFSIDIPGHGVVNLVAGQAYLSSFPGDMEFVNIFNPNNHRIIHIDLEVSLLTDLQMKTANKTTAKSNLAVSNNEVQWVSYSYGLKERGILQLIFENSDVDEVSRALKYKNIQALLKSLMILNRQKGRLNVFRKITYRPEVVERIAHAKIIMDFWEGKPVSIENLSKLTLLNEKTLKTGVKEMFGQTIHGYQIGIRLERSRKLLRETDMSVGEIAHSIGYDDHSSFTKKFKRAYKLGPLQYRHSTGIGYDLQSL